MKFPLCVSHNRGDFVTKISAEGEGSQDKIAMEGREGITYEDVFLLNFESSFNLTNRYSLK